MQLTSATLTQRRILLLVIAFVCSVALTVITVTPPVVAGDWARLDAFGKYIPNLVTYDWPRYDIQFSLWLTLILAVWWAFRSPKPQHIPNIPNGAHQRVNYALPLLVLIIALGFGLRLYTLGHLPLLVDEIGFAARAADMLNGQRVPIFAPGHNGNPAVFSWLLSGVMSVFGQSLFAARLVSVAFGTLSIPAAYALGRSWWSRRVGLVAAAFLATYPAHVYFSRLALYNIVDPFFALLALAGLALGIRRLRLDDFAQVGILAGVAQYFYHGSRLLPVLIALYVVGWFFTTQNKKVLNGVLVMLLTFGLVSVPRFAPMFTAGLPLTGNLDGVRLPSDLAANGLRSLLAWMGQPDVSLFWLSSAPLLAVVALVVAATGIVLAVRQVRDPRHLVLLAALVLTTVFGGVIWAAAPLYVRYMTALPAIVLLVALPFQNIFYHKATQKAERKAKVRVWLPLAIVVVMMTQGVMMSVQHTNEAHERVPAGLWEADSLARAAAQLPDGLGVQFKVSDDFGTVERILIADYVAFYGQRRAVSILAK